MSLAALRRRYAVPDEPRRSERRLELVVLALAAVALVQLLLLAGRYLLEAAVEAVPPAPDSLDVMALAEPGAVTSEQSLALQARPVFWDVRRPLDPLPGTADGGTRAEAPAGALRGLNVSGILAINGASRVIVTYKGRQQRLAIGDTIDGWTLAEVHPGEAVFANNGVRDVRRLLQLPVVDADAIGGNAGTASGESAGGLSAPPQMQPAIQEQDQEPQERLSLGGQGAD